MRSASCNGSDPFNAGDHRLARCSQGTVADSGPCYSGSECASGNGCSGGGCSDGSACCPGTCDPSIEFCSRDCHRRRLQRVRRGVCFGRILPLWDHLDLHGQGRCRSVLRYLIPRQFLRGRGVLCGKWPKRREFAASFPPTDRPAIRRELAMLCDSMLDYCDSATLEMYAQDRGRGVIAVAALVVSATPTAMRPAIAWPNRGRVKRATTPNGPQCLGSLLCSGTCAVPPRPSSASSNRSHSQHDPLGLFRDVGGFLWPHPASPLRVRRRKAWLRWPGGRARRAKQQSSKAGRRYRRCRSAAPELWFSTLS